MMVHSNPSDCQSNDLVFITNKMYNQSNVFFKKKVKYYLTPYCYIQVEAISPKQLFLHHGCNRSSDQADTKHKMNPVSLLNDRQSGFRGSRSHTHISSHRCQDSITHTLPKHGMRTIQAPNNKNIPRLSFKFSVC